ARLGLSPEKPAGADGKPAAGGATAPAPGAAADDKKAEEEATKEPVRNRVSHIVLYKVRTVPDTGATTSFEILGGTDLPELITGGTAALGGGEGPGPGPIRAGGGAPPGPMPPGGVPGPGGPGGDRPAGAERSSWMPLTSTSGGPGGPGGGEREGVRP